jgi:uncharacterized membrane protein
MDFNKRSDNMVNVSTEITINRDIDIVSEFAANPDHAPEWYVNIDSAEWLTEPPVKEGSKIAFKAKFLGKELAYIYQVTEWVPGERMVMRTAEGPFPMKTTYTWKAVNNGATLMTLRNEGEPKGFSKFISPFMSVMMKKANTNDLKKIKQILEG